MKKDELDKQVRTARAEYYREWRRKNPDKVRAANQRYWEKRVARMLEEGGASREKKF